MENPKFNFQPTVLISSNEDIRYRGSSGGIITQIIQYLFDMNKINTCLGFRFEGVELFKPYLLYKYDDYIQSGSIYHHINIYNFLKENIKNIQPPLFLTCLPCQIGPIRRLLLKHNIDAVMIALVCSSQLEKEATYYFLEKNNIDIKEVEEFRYRGNGWPSGIQCVARDKEYFFHNNNSKWIDIFHSQIFNLKKCFACKDTFGLEADISVADPWLKRYIENDSIGASIVLPHSKKGGAVIQAIIKDGRVKLIELLNSDEVVLSQKVTLVRKHLFKKYRIGESLIIKMIRTSYYKKMYYRISTLHRKIFFKIIAIAKRFQREK